MEPKGSLLCSQGPSWFVSWIIIY